MVQIFGGPLPSLVQLARERLKYIFSRSAYFFEEPNYIFPGTDKSFSDILIDLSKYQSDKLVLGSLSLLNQLYSAEVTLFQKSIQAQLLVTDVSRSIFAEIRKLLPPLRHHLSVDAGESQRVEIIHTLNTLTKMCSLQEDDGQSHQQNQNILYNFGEMVYSVSSILMHAHTYLPFNFLAISCT